MTDRLVAIRSDVPHPTCPHGIESAACEQCDEDVLRASEYIRHYADSLDSDGREMYAEIERLRAAAILAARLRTVERWEKRFCPGIEPHHRIPAQRLDRLRSALDEVLVRMGLMEAEK